MIFKDDDKIFCQSKEFKEGVAKFLIVIHNDLKYEAYHYGVKTAVTASTPKRVNLLDRWSKLGEVIQFLDSIILDHKKEVLLQQLNLLGAGASKVGQKVYEAETLISSFDQASRGRS